MTKNTRVSVAEDTPHFPVATVEFDVLQENLRAGMSGEEALESAIVRPVEGDAEADPSPEPEPASEPESPVEQPSEQTP